MTETIIILDFGSQYSQLIARRVREAQVYAELFPWDASEDDIQLVNCRGIILSGGPSSVFEPGAPQLPDWVVASGLPVLGICYGMQVLAHALGGKVSPADKREFGLASLIFQESSILIKEDDDLQVWMSHGDRIGRLPEGFKVYAATGNSPIAAMGDETRRYYGLQFHPEVRHTPSGTAILTRFVREVCGCQGGWTPQSIINEAVERIQAQVGDAKVLSAVSGGVDSSVATALVGRAIGDQLTAVFVDTGLMRKDEGLWVQRTFDDLFGIQLVTINASDTFFSRLAGVSAPEKKRAIIGEIFIRLFETTAHELEDPPFLVQGTIYPDVVESRAPERGHVHRIKTHHNVGGLPDQMDFDLVEPLRYLFKDEVRRVGETLGLPPELVQRQPFPGPGLAVRCIGELTQERVEKLRKADAIFIEELEKADLLRLDYDQNGREVGTSQAFVVLLPVKAVGVMGDQRTFEEAVVLRAVTTEDFMTADWARLPDSLLAGVANRIINEVQGVNRVLYDITSKPPGTIEWE